MKPAGVFLGLPRELRHNTSQIQGRKDKRR